jgi:hypothetical protein
MLQARGFWAEADPEASTMNVTVAEASNPQQNSKKADERRLVW